MLVVCNMQDWTLGGVARALQRELLTVPEIYRV